MGFDEMTSDTLQTKKKIMREMVLAQRDAMLPAARSTASRLILEKVCAMPQYAQAKVVLTYMGFGSEIETQSFFERIIADSKMAVLPRVDRASQSLILHSACGMSALQESKWGILEPRADAPVVLIEAIEFVLMPGVAFDRFGNRLGYGRGYYDNLISTANQALVRVAAAFLCQIVDHVPVGSRDEKVHRIITESEIIVTSHDR